MDESKGFLIENVEKEEETQEHLQENEKLKKYIRKGDKSLYPNSENINMMKNVVNDSSNSVNIKPSFDATEQADNVISGESLYKTYTFEQSSNNEETEKCIAFWKSVMEKKLAPIKCTIIESTKNMSTPEVVKHESVISDEVKDDEIKKREAQIHEDYKNMWLSALQELQKKRLHEIKLIGKTRCKICESLSSSLDETDKINKKTVKKEISDLNQWESPSRENQLLTKLNSQNSKIKRDSSGLKKNYKVASQGKVGSKNDVSLESGSEQPSNIQTDSVEYEHIDAIQEKKNSGAYSKWRSNKLESACCCNFPNCRCNINPAIVSIQQMPVSSGSVIPCSTSSGSCSKLHATSEESIQQKLQVEKSSQMQYTLQQRTASGILNTDHRHSRVKASLSVMIDCFCDNIECDCRAEQDIISRIPVPQQEINDIPKPPPRRHEVKKVSSLELLRTKLKSSSSCRLIKHDSIEENRGDRQTDRKQSEKSLESIEENTKEDVSNTEEQPNLSAFHTKSGILHEGPREKKVSKSLSVILKNCNCENADCDCTLVKEFLTREFMPKSKSYEIPKPPKLQLGRQKRSSLELLITKRQSAASILPQPVIDDESSKRRSSNSVQNLIRFSQMRNEYQSNVNFLMSTDMFQERHSLP